MGPALLGLMNNLTWAEDHQADSLGRTLATRNRRLKEKARDMWD